jgi:hypothetical protein
MSCLSKTSHGLVGRRSRAAGVGAQSRGDLIPIQRDGEGGETLCTVDKDSPVARAISSSDHPTERAAVMAPSNDRFPWTYSNEAFKRSARIFSARVGIAAKPTA